MSNIEAIIALVEMWYRTKSWAEALICQHLELDDAFYILQPELRGKAELGNSGWFYRTHGNGVEISKVGNKGGIDFDFGCDHPDRYRLKEFMIKQLNDGSLTKKSYHPLLQDESLWLEACDAAKVRT